MYTVCQIQFALVLFSDNDNDNTMKNDMLMIRSDAKSLSYALSTYLFGIPIFCRFELFLVHLYTVSTGEDVKRTVLSGVRCPQDKLSMRMTP
jgi:hypothetical protein